MHKTSMRSLLLVSLLLSTVAAVPATATLEPVSCADVATWVAEHQAQLPTSLAEFASVPDGYETGVFSLLPVEMRDELWSEFLAGYVEAKGLRAEAAEQVQGFAGYFHPPADSADLDQASAAVLKQLLTSFTLHLIDPVADLVVDGKALDQLALSNCDCNRSTDFGCQRAFCLLTQAGCGSLGLDPCNGLFNP